MRALIHTFPDRAHAEDSQTPTNTYMSETTTISKPTLATLSRLWRSTQSLLPSRLRTNGSEVIKMVSSQLVAEIDLITPSPLSDGEFKAVKSTSSSRTPGVPPGVRQVM